MTYVIIIGGTGMLSMASREIAQEVDNALLIARNPGQLAKNIGARSLQLDWKDKDTTNAAIHLLENERKADILISWVHKDGLWCLQGFENLLIEGGRSIRIHGSSVGDPSNGVKTDPPARKDINRQNVVLGWKEELGGWRWLTDSEISESTLLAFRNPKLTSIMAGKVGQPPNTAAFEASASNLPSFKL